MSTTDPRRELVALLPQYLPRRRRGWPGAPLEQSGLERPAFFLLQAIVRELDVDASASEDELLRNLFNPYSTVRPVLERLPDLAACGYLDRDGERYRVTQAGRALIERAEADVRAYVATLRPAPEQEIARLAERFEEIAARLWTAPEPIEKPHLLRTRRLAPAPVDSAPTVRLDEAAYQLWMARDDAHNAAWRSAGFDGPSFDLLSRLWAGDASTEAELIELVRHDQRLEDVARGIQSLERAGYLERADAERLVLTERGRATRDAIEAETDRIYFTPWPPLPDDEIGWMVAALQRVIAGLGG